MTEQHEPNQHHRRETSSDSLLQRFEDGRGMPLDHPIVEQRRREREQQTDSTSAEHSEEPSPE